MKAILLAAGRGTRLGPLTRATPKCLVDIDGRPLLGHWLELLARHGVSEVRVNTHHLAGEVEDFLTREQAPPALSVSTVFEPRLLGTAGTVRASADWLEGSGTFLVAHADNLTNADLSAMRRQHLDHRGLLTIALFRTPDPSSCGIVTLDDRGLVTAFEEKPERPTSDLANGGIYLIREELLPLLPAEPPELDFGYDVLPSLLGQIFGWRVDGFLADIGTPERLASARTAWLSAERS